MVTVDTTPSTFGRIHPIEPDAFRLLMRELGGVKFPGLESKVALVLDLATRNSEQWSNPRAPYFAAAVFDSEDKIIGAGIDSPGPRGHEVNNALITARASLGTRYEELRSGLVIVSTTPPCADCFQQITIHQPGAVVSLATLGDLLDRIPTLDSSRLAPSDWTDHLQKLGIRVSEGTHRKLWLALQPAELG